MPSDMNAKHASESMVETRYIVMPNETNHHNIIFGGVLMSWIDLVAAMVAERHSEEKVVTVSLDNISFLTPIYVGEHVHLVGRVNYVGNSTMEVGVRVTKENPFTKDITETTTAYVTLMALDDNMKSIRVPSLLLQTDEDEEHHQEANIRVASRKELRKKLRNRR